MSFKKTLFMGLLASTMLAGCNGNDDKSPPADTTSQGTFDQLKAEIGQLKEELGRKDQENQQTFAELKATLAQLQALGLGELKQEVAALQSRVAAAEEGLKKLTELSAHLDKIDIALEALDAKTLSGEDRSKLDTLHADFALLKADYDAAVNLAGDPAATTTLTKLLIGLTEGKADKTLIEKLQQALGELTEGFGKAKLGTEKSAGELQTRIAVLEAAVKALTPEDLAKYVNTSRGSADPGELAKGSTFPATAMPFGFNMWSPVNSGSSGSVFYKGDTNSTMDGLMLTHEASRHLGNRQAMLILPATDAANAKAQAFQRKNQVTKAHYYSVTFDNGMKTEITPTDHAAYFRITAPASAEKAGFKFDTFSGTLNVDREKGTASGKADYRGDAMTPQMYYFVRFDNKITNSQDGSWVEFATPSGAKTVGMRIATSFISEKQAEDNLDQEIANKSFDEVLALAEDAWNKRLNTIRVEGASEDQKIILYSNMYRSFLYPNSAWENVKSADGKYEPRYSSPYTDTDKVKKGKTWVNNGFWDTYRTTWPLYTLLTPNAAGEMLDGFVNGYKDGGWTTRWSNPGYRHSMVATSLDVILADAYMKGVRNFDIDAAYKSMLRNATSVSPNIDRGRIGMNVWPFYGYMPSSVNTSDPAQGGVAWSMEGSVNDFGLAQMAKELGKTDDAAYFANQAINYAKLFDATSTGTWSGGWFRRKNEAGNFVSDASTPQTWGYGYTEGNAWSYAFLAPQDGQGLANLYGGRDKLKTKLDAFFTTKPALDGGSYGRAIHENHEAARVHELANVGEYQHSNQTVHHSIYMYNYSGSPASGQKYLRDVMDKLYFTGFDKNGVSNGEGYIGDEDNGEMSGWYVLSAMGFYPVSMGRPEYAIGAPYFEKMTVKLLTPDNKVKHVTINAPGVSSANRYVQSLKLNGKPYARNYLLHSDIKDGATLDFVMGPNPSQWGTGEDDVPTSITKGSAKPTPLASLLPTANYDVTASTATNVGRLFDRNSGTEWSGPAGTAPWIEANLKAGKTSSVAKLYTLTSAASAGQDPAGWTLKGSDDGTTWVTLDERKDQVFTWRQQTRPFAIKDAKAYARYRLEFTGTAAIAVPEFELLAEPVTP